MSLWLMLVVVVVLLFLLLFRLEQQSGTDGMKIQEIVDSRTSIVFRIVIWTVIVLVPDGFIILVGRRVDGDLGPADSFEGHRVNPRMSSLLAFSLQPLLVISRGWWW